MTLHLYNTMSRRVEEFRPLQAGRVSMYTCGPTVYNYAHIGNFRTFLFEDLLRRWLEASGYEVFHVMNLTDVDDKTIAGALRAGVPLRAYARRFIDAFFEDRDYLRIRPAHAYPRATEFVPAMVRLVEGLLAKGVAYRGEDGSVYFAIGRFPAYGRLSRLDRRELRAGASGRVSSDEYAKEDARDFVLWKAATPEDERVGAAWDAPFGRGRPGWHLECSAMALALVGERFGTEVLDIHAGGVDLIFPHHEDEIAQSCAYTGREEFARYWVHGEFLDVNGEKMSKRFGNMTTARDLREDGVDAGAIRLFVFQTHYRQKLDLTDDALAAARQGSRRLGEFRDRLAGAPGGGAEAPELVRAAERFEQQFRAALDDDLNAPRAVAALHDFVTEANRLLDAGSRPGPAVRRGWELADRVLDVAPPPTEVRRGTMSPGLEGASALGLPELLARRGELGDREWFRLVAAVRFVRKAQRRFAEADELRGVLRDAGVEVRDRKDGFELRSPGEGWIEEVTMAEGAGSGAEGTR